MLGRRHRPMANGFHFVSITPGTFNDGFSHTGVFYRNRDGALMTYYLMHDGSAKIYKERRKGGDPALLTPAQDVDHLYDSFRTAVMRQVDKVRTEVSYSNVVKFKKAGAKAAKKKSA